MYLVPKEGYHVGVDRDEQNLRHHVSMTQLIGGKRGMNKQELKDFICNEINYGSPTICLERFLKPCNHRDAEEGNQKKDHQEEEEN